MFLFFSNTLDIQDGPVYSFFSHENEVVSMRVYEAFSLDGLCYINRVDYFSTQIM